jgi:hypothetical protein
LSLVRLIAIVIGILFAGSATTGVACSSPAAYRSVIVNSVPDQISDDYTVFHVRIESAYVVAGTIQGVRGTLVEPVQAMSVGAEIEVSLRLASMCDTWIEMWSENATVTDGVISGYIVGKTVGEIEGRTIIWPALYRGENYRAVGGGEGKALDASNPRFQAKQGGNWGAMRVDEEALANNLNETNRMIREGLKDGVDE